MAKPRAEFKYGYDTVSKLSDWPYDRLLRDVSDGTVNMDDLASVCLWLASNGKPRLRAALASKLLPAIFGTSGRRAVTNQAIESMASTELMQLVFEQSAQQRKKVAKTCGPKP